MPNTKLFSRIAGVCSCSIFIMGVLQIILYIPRELEIMNNAELQGVAQKQISEYFWQQVLPQVLSYVMATLAFSFITLTIRFLCLKFDMLMVKKAEVELSTFNNMTIPKDETDDFLDDFEVVKETNNEKGV